MLQVMLDPYGPVICEFCGEGITVLGRVITAEFYNHIPAEWVDEVQGWINGAGNNL
jgi:hypothetical protein